MPMHTREQYSFGLVSKLPAQLFLYHFYAKRIVTDNIITMFKSHFTVCVGCLPSIIADLPNTGKQSRTRFARIKVELNDLPILRNNVH